MIIIFILATPLTVLTTWIQPAWAHSLPEVDRGCPQIISHILSGPREEDPHRSTHTLKLWGYEFIRPVCTGLRHVSWVHTWSFLGEFSWEKHLHLQCSTCTFKWYHLGKTVPLISPEHFRWVQNYMLGYKTIRWILDWSGQQASLVYISVCMPLNHIANNNPHYGTHSEQAMHPRWNLTA